MDRLIDRWLKVDRGFDSVGLIDWYFDALDSYNERF